MKKNIQTNFAPQAIGPYSQAINAGNMLFISGQIPIDPKSGKVEVRDIKNQTRQSLSNISAILQAVDLNLSDVVKTTVFLKDMEMFTDMNEVYASFFDGIPPARSTIEVARLPKDVLVEIEAIAVKI